MVGVLTADETVRTLDADGTKAATGRRVAVEKRAAAADRWSFISGDESNDAVLQLQWSTFTKTAGQSATVAK